MNKIKKRAFYTLFFYKILLMQLSNLLVVAGSGRNSGKTTFVCRIIEQFSHLGITSIKISPHFHEPSTGLVHVSGKPGFEIYEETSRNSTKDSSRMLECGATKVYYIQTLEESLYEAFSEVYLNMKIDRPVICESPSLINYLTPGMFVIMRSTYGINRKNIDDLIRHPHLQFTYDELIKTENLPVDFSDGHWKSPIRFL
jgi:hypothetical protein